MAGKTKWHYSCFIVILLLLGFSSRPCFSNVFLQICQRECIYPKLILLAISYASEEESQIRNFVVILAPLALVEHIQDTMPAYVPRDIMVKDSLAIVHVRYLILSAHLKESFIQRLFCFLESFYRRYF